MCIYFSCVLENYPQVNRLQTGKTVVISHCVTSYHTCCKFPFKTQIYFLREFSQFFVTLFVTAEAVLLLHEPTSASPLLCMWSLGPKKATQVRNEIAEARFSCGNEHKWLIKAIESALPVVSGGCYLLSSWATEDLCSCGAWVQLIATGVLVPVWTF